MRGFGRSVRKTSLGMSDVAQNWHRDPLLHIVYYTVPIFNIFRFCGIAATAVVRRICKKHEKQFR